MLDLVLAPHRWKNLATNVASHPAKATDSDHPIVTASLRVKLTGSKKDKETPIITYRKPKENDRKEYNDKIREIYQTLSEIHQRLEPTSAAEDGVTDFPGASEANEQALTKTELLVKAFNPAVADTPTPISKEQKQSYISQDTWNLVEERQQARNSGDADKETELIKSIRKSANQDKKRDRLSKPEDYIDLREKWTSIKRKKSKYTPHFNKAKDIRGNRIPRGKKAEATAEYLEQIQWKDTTDTLPAERIDQKLIRDDLGIRDGPITEQELDRALRRLKNNKAPGPDRSTTELYKWLGSENRELVLEGLAEYWNEAKVPSAITAANIASLYKKRTRET